MPRNAQEREYVTNKEISVEMSRRKVEGIEGAEYNISHREVYISRIRRSNFFRIRTQGGKKGYFKV